MSLITGFYPEFSPGNNPFDLIIAFFFPPFSSFWLKEENVVLKFSEQGGTPQNVATSSSLTAHLRSLSKGDSPVASPFQNYSSIHSQSRSTSSPSLHSRSPSISNMAALRWELSVEVFPCFKQDIPRKRYFLLKLTFNVLKDLKFLLTTLGVFFRENSYYPSCFIFAKTSRSPGSFIK